MWGGEGLFWGHVGILVPGGYSVTEMLLRDPSCDCSLGQPIPGRAKEGVSQAFCLQSTPLGLPSLRGSLGWGTFVLN